MEYDDPHQWHTRWPQRSKVKVIRSRRHPAACLPINPRSRRNTKIGNEGCPCHGWHSTPFQDRSRSSGHLTPWPKILATLTCAMTSKAIHHLQSAEGVCILWRPKHRPHNAQLVLPLLSVLLSVCQQDNSQRCWRILMNYLEEWNMWLATKGYILVLIMRIQEFLKDFLPVRDTGNCTNYTESSRSCWRIPMKFLTFGSSQ